MIIKFKLLSDNWQEKKEISVYKKIKSKEKEVAEKLHGKMFFHDFGDDVKVNVSCELLQNEANLKVSNTWMANHLWQTANRKCAHG